MTRPTVISVCCALLASVVALQATAQTPTARERVSPEGPYRSQVRLLDDEASTPPTAEQALTAANDYGRALILRQLGLNRIADGNDGGAIDALEQAVALGSLAPLAQAQMQANLGQLYLAAGRAEDAARSLRAALDADLGDAVIAIALAGAELELGHYAAAAEAAIGAIDRRPDAPEDWLRIAIYALTRDGRPLEAAAWQLRLLESAPDDPHRWLQLGALYAEAGEAQRAAATLATASAGGIELSSEQRLQAVQWLATSGVPAIAAHWLETALTERSEAEYWRWLLQLHLAARDDHAALAALEQTATRSTVAADWLAAGELALTLGDTERAVGALRRATGDATDGATRARALLLLGQSYAGLGRHNAARRSLNAASAYGGTVYQAATAGLDALGVVVPPAASVDSAVEVAGDAAAIASSRPALQLVTKTVPALRVYAARETTDAARLVDEATGLVRDLLRTSRRERLEWTGPLHLVFRGDLDDPDAVLELHVAAPIRRVAPSRGRFRSGELETFRCAWRRYTGPWDELNDAWRGFYRDVIAAGITPGQEARQVVLHRGGDSTDSVIELQIGIL